MTSFVFDPVGNLTRLTNPAGNTIVIRYDEANRIHEVVQSGASPIQFKRDPAGRVIEMTDRNGAVTKYGYDPLGRLVSLHEPDWPASAPMNAGKQLIIGYDPQGKRLRVSDTEVVGDCLYHYDPAGNLVERDDPDGSTLLFEYDARNALVRVHDGASAIDLRFTLDGDGRLLSLTDSAYLDPARTYTYHRAAGTLVDNLYGIDYDTSKIATRFEYNPNRQLTLATHSLNRATLADYGYDYRSDGLVGSQAGTRVAAYDYDDSKQLISEGPGIRDGYDAAGNRLWRAATPPPVAQQATFDTQNRMLSDGHGITYDYDANGNLLKRTPPGGAPTAYTYDGANRLRLADDGVTAVRYRYDADGRMIERTSQRGTRTDTRGYRYSNRRILAELDARGNIAVLYTRDDGGRLLRRRSRTALRPTPSQDPHSLFYLSDGLGNIVRMVDSDGKPHFSHDYDAWGGSAGSGRIGTFRYRSGYEDSYTKLLNFGARWYDPILGRWLSPDPLLPVMTGANSDVLPHHPELTNLYRYVSNNPVNLWDPTGLDAAEKANAGYEWLGNLASLLNKTEEVAGTRFAPIIAGVDAVISGLDVPLRLIGTDEPHGTLGAAHAAFETTRSFTEGFVALQILARVGHGATFAAAATDVATAYPLITGVAEFTGEVGIGIAVIAGSFKAGYELRLQTNAKATELRDAFELGVRNYFFH